MSTVLSKIARKGFARFLVVYLCMALSLPLTAIPAAAAPGDTLVTPVTPMELPIEVEIELSPAGSLKQALLWKELYQLLKNPYAVVCPPDDPATPFSNESNYCVATIERRPAFQGPGVTLPPANIYSLGYNFLTAQPMRLRTSDGEVSWDQPGPMFDPAEDVAPNQFNTPTVIRTPIGHLVACPNVDDPATPVVDESYQAAVVPAAVCAAAPVGSLVVYNSTASPLIPPTGTVVAVSAFVGGVLNELDPATQELIPVVELEAPINEEDFLRQAADNTGVPIDNAAALIGFIGRPGAEVLGKALFWDMQVGSDGIQACGSCHFHGGADNRTRNQLNPDVLGGGTTLTIKGANQDVVASDFPFHKRIDPETPGDGTDPAIVVSDSPDVMSSMGVRFRTFVDIPPIAQLIDANTKPKPGRFNEAFNIREPFIDPVTGLPVTTNPRVLPPDIGIEVRDPVDVGKTENFAFFAARFRNGLFADPFSKFFALVDGLNLRRVEPRNTPTFHGAAFNLDNFWDGRARFNFNGGSVFGPADPQFHVFLDNSAFLTDNNLVGATHGHLRPDLLVEDPEVAEQPLRIKFSSLASQSVGPPLSNFEMSFDGRNWAKLGKKMLQAGVTPLANQLVDLTDSVLGPFSNRGGDVCTALGRPTNDRMPGICVTYPELIQVAFMDNLWRNGSQHLDGAPALCAGLDNAGFPTPPGCDPFDGYVLSVGAGPAALDNTNQFNQMEANFSLFFGIAVQAYEALTIADDTPADRFFDANPNAGHAVGEPGDQAVLFPTLIPDLIDDGELNGTVGTITLIPDNPLTPEYDGFGPDEVFGFDIFAGANLTAALPLGQSVGQSGRDRNPAVTITRAAGDNVTIRVGSNPFTRSAKCMLCHLGPEQTDHSINISHGVLKNDAEFEYPTPPRVNDPLQIFADNVLPTPEPSGSSRTVAGLILAEEVGEGPPQDAVEVEPRNFATLDDPATPWDERIISQPSNFAFGDQGIYNIGLRPIREDLGRGGGDPFGWPLSLSALTLKNIGGADFDPCDGPADNCVMANFDPANIEAVDDLDVPIPGQQGFEETGDGAVFPGTTFTLQSINPGFERDPILPQLPPYLAPFVNHLPAGELHPQIDEMAGMVPNTITPPNGGPGIEFPEALFGADVHCARYDPAIFGLGPPNFGWGPPTDNTRVCPQHQSGVAGNFAFPSQGTWPVSNRVLADGAFKAPQLRNVELTGPYFHTGSYLTLRQVVDFYFRGGDFPISNAENRDPHIVDIDEHAFSLGRTSGADLRTPINFPGAPGNDNVPTHPYLVSDIGFGDGLPDTNFLYDEYPDSNHPVTPEPVFASRAAAIEDAKESLVKFLLALTDPRVKYERAPFDRPEIFVPVDGTAPDNIFGREALAVDATFRRIAAVGAAGNATPLPNFLGVKSSPCIPGVDNVGCVSHFDSVSSASAAATPATAAATSSVTATSASASLAGTAIGSPIAMTVVAAIPPVTAVTLTPSTLGPLSAGTSVAWTATASGGLGLYEYEIWLWDGSWSIVKGYDELGNSWNWNTTGLAAGTYYVTVYARTPGSGDAGEVVADVIPFVLQ